MRVHPAMVQGISAKLLIVHFDVVSPIILTQGASFDTGIMWADPDDHQVTFDFDLKDYATLILKGTGYSSYSISIPPASGSVSGAGRTGAIEFVDPDENVIGGADFGFNSIATSVQIPLHEEGDVSDGGAISRPSGVRYTGLVSSFSGGGRVFSGSLVIDSPTYILLCTDTETVIGEEI